MRSAGANCDRAREWASLRLDGELSDLEWALLEAHLTRCIECRAFADDSTAIALGLREAPLERLEQPVALPSRRRALGSTRAVQLGAAAVLVVAAAGLGSLFGALGSGASHPPARPAQRPAVQDVSLAFALDEQPRGLPSYPRQDFMRRKGLAATYV